MSFTTFLIFHCNLAFSSIEERDRLKVIERCYYPMLDIAEEGIPIGVEATGWTLEMIAELQPAWIEKLRALVKIGQVEYVGSGYAQVIGPLVPWLLNLHNQMLGQSTYADLLGICPNLALINEQAYAPGIVEAYKRAGYKSVFMEWDNSHLNHPEWPTRWRYAPQKLRGGMTLLWNQSEIFQQLQRYVHAEQDLEDYLSYLEKHFSHKDGILCLYGNDAEIFNFRPGRFETEASLSAGEWKRLANALRVVSDRYECNFSLPSKAATQKLTFGNRCLQLESARQPIIVKKQPKYNILRWAVTGRDDEYVNSRCYKLFNYLISVDPECRFRDKWKKLCYLWSSDYRTHITDSRWDNYVRELAETEALWAPNALSRHVVSPSTIEPQNFPQGNAPYKKYMKITTDQVVLKLNCWKGLAIESACFPEISPFPLFGTLQHGFFEDISLAADFFSGHTVMEILGDKKYTDLAKIVPLLDETHEFNSARCFVPRFYCPMAKIVRTSKKFPLVQLEYSFMWDDIPRCTLRLLHLTLNPVAFDRKTLFYAASNGGSGYDRFPLQETVDFGAPVSSTVSANCALGMTNGSICIGDRHKYLIVSIDQSASFTVGLVSFRYVGQSFLMRLSIGVRETDDTAKAVPHPRMQTISITIKAVHA